jgi:hypothetical protein
MSDGVDIPIRPIANDNRPSDATGDGARGQTRELARRLSGTLEVLLLWRPNIDQVELCVSDWADGTGFRIAVASADAIDAFYHPYVYAATANALAA